MAVDDSHGSHGGLLISTRAGFEQEGLLDGHAVDYQGRPRNLVLLSYQLSA